MFKELLYIMLMAVALPVLAPLMLLGTLLGALFG